MAGGGGKGGWGKKKRDLTLFFFFFWGGGAGQPAGPPPKGPLSGGAPGAPPLTKPLPPPHPPRAKRGAGVAAGAPVNTEASCTPNIEIVFTTTPQDLLDAVSKNDQHYLGYFSSVAEKKSLATVTRPIQAWYATESTDLRGQRRLDTGRSIV